MVTKSTTFSKDEGQLIAALEEVNRKTMDRLGALAVNTNFADGAVRTVQNTLYNGQASLASGVPKEKLEAFMNKLGGLLERYELWRAEQYKTGGSLLEVVVEDRFSRSTEFSEDEKRAINAYRDAARLSRMEIDMSRQRSGRVKLRGGKGQ